MLRCGQQRVNRGQPRIEQYLAGALRLGTKAAPCARKSDRGARGASGKRSVGSCVRKETGGASRNRTDVEGFAVLCITTLPSRPKQKRGKSNLSPCCSVEPKMGHGIPTSSSSPAPGCFARCRRRTQLCTTRDKSGNRRRSNPRAIAALQGFARLAVAFTILP